MQSDRLSRREFITLLGSAAAAWPLAARAQQPAMPVIGFLSFRSSGTDAPLLVSFRQGLSESGFVEGKNVAIEYRYAEGQSDRMPLLMRDLVARRVAVVVTTGGYQSALAAKAATSTIPIVFTSGGDPVKEGLVDSLNRPGGNLTGVTASQVDAASKRLGLLREISPKGAVIGVLVNPDDPISTNSETNDMRTAARSVGQRIEILQAASARDIEMVFASLTAMQLGALVVTPDPFFGIEANRLIALAARRALPMLYWRREFAKAGGL